MADVGFQLACDGGRAQAAVQEPDVVGFALEDADDGAVDAAAAVICRSSSASWVAGRARRHWDARLVVSWRGDTPRRRRQSLGIWSPSAMRSKT